MEDDLLANTWPVDEIFNSSIFHPPTWPGTKDEFWREEAIDFHSDKSRRLSHRFQISRFSIF